MSLGVRHSMLFVAAIQVASLGADQFSLGITEPLRSAMVDFIFVWMSCQAREGSGGGSSSSSDCEPHESVSELLGGRSSGGSLMPSARRYERNSRSRGMRRAFGVRERYLRQC